MRRRIRFSFLLFPVLGIVFGIIYAFMFMHGLIVTWHFVGNPSEKITRIIGFVGGHNLFVKTESGNVYSLEYYNYVNLNDFLPTPIKWKKEEKNNLLQPDPERKSYMEFISLPLLFSVKQFYEMNFPLVEGEFLVKFALSEDGNLWMWNYGKGGMAGLSYFFFPAMGLFFGGILALVIKAGMFLWKTIKHR